MVAKRASSSGNIGIGAGIAVRLFGIILPYAVENRSSRTLSSRREKSGMRREGVI